MGHTRRWEGSRLQHARLRGIGRHLPIALVILFGSGPVGAQVVDGRSVLGALEAARRDGYRLLLEQVEGVVVSGTATVRDLALASSSVSTQLTSFIRGAVVESESIEADGSATVVVSLRKADLERLLGRTLRYSDEVIRALGRGAPSTVLPPSDSPTGASARPSGLAPLAIATRRSLEQIPIEGPPAAFRVTGSAVPLAGASSAGQRRLTAQTAARTDAYRRLLEVLGGLQVSASTTVRDLMLASDNVAARVNGFIRGAVVIAERFSPDEVAEVTLEVDLVHLRRVLLP